LIVEGHANPHEIGRCAIATEAVAGLLFQNHLFRLRSRGLDEQFAELWLNSQFVRAYWHRVCSTSSGLNTINSRQLRALPVAVPPMHEQKRIVAHVQLRAEELARLKGELAKLRLVRRGLMDDLLTGLVRVVVGNVAAT
jgi:type I restriction enzyme S subunit